MKVYVIEKGCYSDRHIIGVVETEEEAKKICKVYSDDYDDATYEEYDTKQFTDNRIRFVVVTDDKTWAVRTDDYDMWSLYKENSKVYDSEYVIYAYSKEQAVKIVQDMKAVEKAREEGIL